MKYTIFFMAILVLFTASKCDESKGKDKILRISHGTSFGMCQGYCFNEKTYTSEYTINYSKAWGRIEPGSLPDKLDSVTVDQAIWKELCSKIDTAIFNNLPETIGCPDCADGGAEWIEIQTNTRTHRVTFEFGQTLPEIAILVERLREETNKNKTIDQ